MGGMLVAMLKGGVQVVRWGKGGVGEVDGWLVVKVSDGGRWLRRRFEGAGGTRRKNRLVGEILMIRSVCVRKKPRRRTARRTDRQGG